MSMTAAVAAARSRVRGPTLTAQRAAAQKAELDEQEQPRAAAKRKAPSRVTEPKEQNKKACEKKSQQKKSKKKSNPFTRYFDALRAKCIELGALSPQGKTVGGYAPYILVRGTNDPNEDSPDEEGDAYSDSLTEEDMARMRVVIMNAERDKAIDAVQDDLLENQPYRDMFLSFNTDFSWLVIRTLDEWLEQYEKRPQWQQWPRKANVLMALTHCLLEHDVWLHDHEISWLDPADRIFKRLAKAWKGALKKSDEVLGIDAAYTRPALIAMCEDFKEKIESIDMCGHRKNDFVFNFM